MGQVPEVFDLGDEGTVRILIEHPDESFRRRLEDAVSDCPTFAISIVEDE